MKKLVSVLLAALLLLSSSCLAVVETRTRPPMDSNASSVPSIDWASLTNDQIAAIIGDALAEIGRRQASISTQPTSAPQLTVQPRPTSAAQWFSRDGYSFCVTGFYKYSNGQKEYLIIEFDWKNTSSKPDSFFLKLDIEGYQNGIELSSDYISGFDENDSTKILPTYQTTSYAVLRLADKSDIIVYIDDSMDFFDKFDDLVYSLSYSELEQLTLIK